MKIPCFILILFIIGLPVAKDKEKRELVDCNDPLYKELKSKNINDLSVNELKYFLKVVDLLLLVF